MRELQEPSQGHRTPTRWFKRWGWLYLPIHPFGFIVTLLAVIFMIPICMAIVRNGHSVTDDLYQIFIYGTCTSFWWKWIAEKTSLPL